MMGGFGSIRAMQDSLKLNRSMLKKHRKSFKELAEKYPLDKRHDLQLHEPKITPAESLAFRRALLLKRKRERRRRLVLALFLAVVGVVMISLILY